MWLFCGFLYICQTGPACYRLINGFAAQPNAWAYIGAVVSAVGIAMEATADKQKSAQKEKNPGMPAMKGLFRLCRCPNYFGEILFWTGVFLSGIGALYPLTPVDPGEFRTMKVSGMHFTVTAYDAKGLGRIGVMNVHGMLGMMRMQTMIVNPFYVDAPMLSLDAISAMGNETLMLEPFDTQLAAAFDDGEMAAVRDRYASIPEKDPGQHWYDGPHLPSMVCKKGKNAVPRWKS